MNRAGYRLARPAGRGRGSDKTYLKLLLGPVNDEHLHSTSASFAAQKDEPAVRRHPSGRVALLNGTLGSLKYPRLTLDSREAYDTPVQLATNDASQAGE